MRKTAFIFLLIITNLCFAKEPYTGADYSGVYNCTGEDSHEGPYTGLVTLKLVPSQSTGIYGAYEFKLEVPEYGIYLGQAASENNVMGINFALTNPEPKDYGTGIARFSKTKNGKWTFKKYYYEKEFKGGNYGTEVCTQQ
jgi:hypothetical protein